jgi:hypothetical protein
MALDTKYGRVTTERGDIGTDEPVVVFRAQDALLPAVLDYYRELANQAGSLQKHLDLIDRYKVNVIEWQRSNFTKISESFSYGDGTVE